MVSFVGLALGVDDFSEFSEEAFEVLGDEVGADGVFLGEVVGGFPLMNVEFTVGVVEGRVVSIRPLPHLEVAEPDPPGESSQIIRIDPQFSQEGQHLLGLLVAEGEDFGLLDAGVIGAVGHWARVVVGVKSCVHQ